jgi:hypothetical protein
VLCEVLKRWHLGLRKRLEASRTRAILTADTLLVRLAFASAVPASSCAMVKRLVRKGVALPAVAIVVQTVQLKAVV